LAAISQRPVGSSAKFRGVCPRVGWYSTSVSAPPAPTVKTAMLSCPRLDPYTNRPLGCTAISAVEPVVTSAGLVETLPDAVSLPDSWSHENVVMVAACSVIANSHVPFG
jgi:hypothetical protein